MKKQTRKKLLYATLGLFVLSAIGVFGGLAYFKHTWFRDTPNTLTIAGDLHPVPFEWSADEHDQHSAMLIPVSIPGFEKTFYMQFDTGASNTFLRSGALESLMERGCDFELFKENGLTYFRRFELNIGGNRVTLKPGWVRDSAGEIDWETAANPIGTIGSDFLDQRICAIDFPAMEIRLYADRPQALDALGNFTPFDFTGRKIVLPITINGASESVIYDSGCSAFGLLTSNYYYEKYSDPSEPEINYNANRDGDPVPVHHRTCGMPADFGDTRLPLKRISYVDLYGPVQAMVGRFSSFAGFIGILGNETLTDSTLILDAKVNEYLVVRGSVSESP